MSKNNKQKEFPSIYRVITEKNNAPLIVLSILLCVALLIVGIDLDNNIKEREAGKKVYDEKTREIKFWEEGIALYPGFRDGYFQLAILEYERGNFEKSREYLRKVMLIDPYFEESKKLEKILGD